LRRFPLEAGVPHDFAEMDDRAGTLMRAEVVEELAAGADVGAVDALARHFSGEDFEGILAELTQHSAAFATPLSRNDALAMFGLPGAYGADALVADVFAGGEAELFAELVPLLRTSGKNDTGAADKLAALNFARPDPATCAALESVLLFGKGAKAPFSAKTDTFPTKALRPRVAHLLPQLEALMLRVQEARPRRIAMNAAEKTLALHRFAGAYLPRYAARKAARGWLDFDDLILRASALLNDPSVAQWVLFRLDGGIDHILVDEAQDTSPAQWDVIASLAAEFTAGEGARSNSRTMFVVGDRKQSIYSFQGADLREFERMRAEFQERFRVAGKPMQGLELAHSFRSSDAILRLVDLTFDARVQSGLGGATRHIAFHTGLPGRVDLWPVVPKAEKPADSDWREPLGLRGAQNENVVLARAIASEIARLIATSVCIPSTEGPRPVHEGDFLILVQRRSAMFAEVIRACKAAGLAIAGADRLKLGAELAVRDIGSVLAFLATPEDDLALAEALKSPLFGWTEAELYALAQPRKGFLWEALRDDTAHAATLDILNDLRGKTDFLRPFELIERLLTRHGGRARLVARLGPEAEDGIDELLSQALAFEQAEVPSLTGFLGWLSADDVEVKRSLGAAGRAIRVMTVHGAKGLESPIVILPDTGTRKNQLRSEVLPVGKHAAWKTGAEETPKELAAARDALLELQQEERMRLLYVAMTRAEKWLIVCAAGEVGEGADSWYSLVQDAMKRAETEPDFVSVLRENPVGIAQRISFGDWPDPQDPATGAAIVDKPELPPWALSPAPAPAAPQQVLSPSDLGGAKALPGETLLDQEAAKRRGRQLHLLLQHLPAWPEAGWDDAARALLSGGEDAADPAETEPILAEARRVLAVPELRDFLVPDALVEVEFTAQLPELGGRSVQGTVDRLVITNSALRILDYKSNALVPASPQEVPEGILRQMGAYAAALGQIYPGRAVETALLWTATGKFMPLPPATIYAALCRTPTS
ncbi:MAG: double-strand break repair helicase AddA, partial [Pseudorhodobacter sp.]|nr:double-strand break repair helicase AddA [Pseudorhodobacter sp.]